MSKEEGEMKEVAANQDRSTKVLWPQKKPQPSFAGGTNEGMFFSKVLKKNIHFLAFFFFVPFGKEGCGFFWGLSSFVFLSWFAATSLVSPSSFDVPEDGLDRQAIAK